MRSWLSTDCSTQLEVAGVGQPVMRARCGADGDEYRYDPSAYESSDNIAVPELWPVSHPHLCSGPLELGICLCIAQIWSLTQDYSG